MKKYCKNVDITDRYFILDSVYDCLRGGNNGRNKMTRRDTLEMFEEYTGVPASLWKTLSENFDRYDVFRGAINTIVDAIQMEIINRDYKWKPIWHTFRKENDKVRKIGIQDIKQQIYDYIAVNGLKEVLNKKIGYYQCAALPHKGQVFGKKAIEKWVRHEKMRHAWKGDARHYYENIDKNKLKKLLKKYVDNEPLLHLVFALIDSFEKGLEIGSYLSQYLANFYMSFAYHYVEENMVKIRKHRNGTKEKVRLVLHQLYYMDDIAFFGNSLKDLKSAVKMFRKWMWDNLGVEIKQDDQWINFQDGYIDMMGFCVSRVKTWVRSRIFLRLRRNVKKVQKDKEISLAAARRIISRNGWTDNSMCKHWIKKNKVTDITKLCKEMVKHAKNVIRLETRKGHYCAVA